MFTERPGCGGGSHGVSDEFCLNQLGSVRCFVHIAFRNIPGASESFTAAVVLRDQNRNDYFLHVCVRIDCQIAAGAIQTLYRLTLCRQTPDTLYVYTCTDGSTAMPLSNVACIAAVRFGDRRAHAACLPQRTA